MQVVEGRTRMTSILVAAYFIIVVALVQLTDSATAQLSESPAAHADEQQPIGEQEEKADESAVHLNTVDKELCPLHAKKNRDRYRFNIVKRLFARRRKEHLEAVKNLQKMNSYERQYKMINVLAEKMFDVIESKKVLLENFTESDLGSVSFSTTTNNDIKDAISSVLENIALFGDIVFNLPDITQRILKTQPKWNSTIRWSFDFLNRTKDWLDKPTLEMINLVLQELNITKREPDYFNPNRIVKSSQAEDTKKGSRKKEKKKKGPAMTKIEL